MALEGDLKIFRLPDILQMVSQQQKTGILTVQGELDILAVSFLRGEIVAADALNQSFEEGLGDVLASQGLIQPDAFARLSEEQRTSGKRLADYLVEKGFLDRGQLLGALRQQTYRLLLQVLRWSEGEFKFYSGDEVSFEEGMVPISIEELLLRSVGDLMGEGTLSGTLPHGFVAYERLPREGTLKVLGVDGDRPSEDPGDLWISQDERSLLERLDGVTTASKIGESSGLGEYKTLYGLYRLLKLGLVRPAGGTQPEATAPSVETVEEPKKRSRSVGIELPKEIAFAARTWIGALLGLGALVVGAAVVTLAVREPAATLLPFPWQSEERESLATQRRVAHAQLVDRAARTFFLVEGRYPDRLPELVASGLLPERDLRDPEGRALHYRAEALSYVLRTLPGAAGSSAPAMSETITGDFMVDPEFYRNLEVGEGTPLVLLD